VGSRFASALCVAAGVVGVAASVTGAAPIAAPLRVVATRTAVSAAPPRGNTQGLALLSRVHRAYMSVPAVSVTARIGSRPSRFTIILRSGIVTAEQFVYGTGADALMLVASGSATTYRRQPGSSCWQKVPAAQSLDAIGLPFPDSAHMNVGKPEHTTSGWLLPVSGDGGPSTFAIAGTTFRLRSITVRSPGTPAIVEQVSVLRVAPRLDTASPRC
jgi:uncharacterized protein YaiE (UPF0345 family)